MAKIIGRSAPHDHPDPNAAVSDGRQSLTFEEFRKMTEQIGAVAAAIGRRFGVSESGSAG